MADTTLRPRSATEILDAAFALVRRDYVRFVTITAIAFAPYLVLIMLLSSSFGYDGTVSEDVSILSALGALIIVPFFIVWQAVINGALVVAASESYMGREVSVGEAVRVAFSRFGAILAAGFLKGLIVFIGFLLLIFPGVYFYLRYIGVPATIVIEGKRALGGMERSADLTAGHKGRIFPAVLLAWLIVWGLSSIGSVIGMLFVFIAQNFAVMQLISTLLQILVYPLIAVVETLIYYDLRIRKEGFDLEVMAAEMGGPETPQPAY